MLVTDQCVVLCLLPCVYKRCRVAEFDQICMDAARCSR